VQSKWIALSVTTVGTLMAGIDARVIIVGLPTVARELGADVESIIWVRPSYSFDYKMKRHIEKTKMLSEADLKAFTDYLLRRQ